MNPFSKKIDLIADELNIPNLKSFWTKPQLLLELKRNSLLDYLYQLDENRWLVKLIEGVDSITDAPKNLVAFQKTNATNSIRFYLVIDIRNPNWAFFLGAMDNRDNYLSPDGEIYHP